MSNNKLISEARKLIAQCMTYNFGMYDADKLAHEVAGNLADALEQDDRELAEARAEIERLHSWDGLMELLDEHWPESMIPTLADNEERDAGPRIVSLIRWVAALTLPVGKAVQVSRGALAQVLIDHTRINGISGECSCGIMARLGGYFAGHQADEILAMFALTPEPVQPKLDPHPWVWAGHSETDKMRSDTQKFRKGAPRGVMLSMSYVFRPRPEYSQNRADYGTGESK